MFGACDVFACRDQGRSCATPRMRWIGGPRAGGTAGFVRLIENCSVCSTAFAVSTCKAEAGDRRSRDPVITVRSSPDLKLNLEFGPNSNNSISMPNPIRNFRVWLSRPWSPAQSARVLAFGPPLPPAVRSAPPLRPPRAHTSYGIRNATTVPGCRVRSGREGGARREPVECGVSSRPAGVPRPRTTIFYYSSLYCCKSNLSSLATDSTSASAASHRKRGASM